MGSFKVKLVVYFLLLSLLPMAAAFWGFTSVAGHSETRRVDARLQAGLRAVLASYQERLESASLEASNLARTPEFERALEERNRPALARLLARSPDVEVRTVDGLRVGRLPRLAATRRISVDTRERHIATITVAVRYDPTLVELLRTRSGLDPSDALAVLRGSHVVASSPTLVGRVDVAAGAGRTTTLHVAGERFRAVVTPPVSRAENVRLAVLSPQALIDASNQSSRNRLLLGLLASLALVSLVAYFEGRSIVRNLRTLAEAAHGIARGRLRERVPVRGRDEFALLARAFNDMANQLQARLAELESERGRLRNANLRFGEALAATHDVNTLLKVIVETAVEATGAMGARLAADDGRVLDSGNPNADGILLELPLTAARTAFGTLTLVGSGFDDEQRMTANSLASHAAIALENARLHRIVERQALVDGLTGIANRRQCEDALAAEIARSDRLMAPFTVVLADLDDFKAVNDIHGHAVGDEVLREFAAVLRATVRESDVAGRWGGEEFVLLLPGTDAPGGVNLADRVRAGLGERSFIGADGEVLAVTCSFGVAEFQPGDDERELMAAADRALYRAKRDGKNRVEVEAAVRSF